MKTIGILGGMGPEATLLLYRMIVDATPAVTDQQHIPTLIYSNTGIPDRTAAILGRGDDPLPSLIQSAKVLTGGGATILGMPCNTAHHYIDGIQREVTAPIINMVELVYRRIEEHYRQKKIMIFATEGTIKTGIYDFTLRDPDLMIESPGPKQQHLLMNMIYNEIKAGKRPIDLEPYQKLLYQAEDDGVEAVIIGCTELSYLHSQFKFPNNIAFIDPMGLLATALVEAAVEKHEMDPGKEETI